MESLRGSCLCQSHKFEIMGEIKGFFLCHCSNCRKSSGSAHGANLFVKDMNLNWTKSEGEINSYQKPNTRFKRAFCSCCGSAMPYLNADGNGVLPAGSLDSEFSLRATAHIHVASRAKWDHELESIYQFSELPG